jgi:hypothetical protein
MQRAQGMTRGLFYLHDNENIIHGNLVQAMSFLMSTKMQKLQIMDYPG